MSIVRTLGVPVAWLLIAWVHAQPVAGSGNPAGLEKVQRRAWFVQTGIPEGVDNPVRVFADGKIQMLTLSNRVASGPIEVGEDGSIRFVKQVADRSEPAKMMEQVMAEAAMPRDWTEALVVMVPKAKADAGGSWFATKVQSLDVFKAGGFMAINLSKDRIRLEVDDAKSEMKPGEIKIHAFAKSQDPRGVPYRYSAFDMKRNAWVPLNASMTIASATRREVLVFSQSEATGKVRCHCITLSQAE